MSPSGFCWDLCHAYPSISPPPHALWFELSQLPFFNFIVATYCHFFGLRFTELCFCFDSVIKDLKVLWCPLSVFLCPLLLHGVVSRSQATSLSFQFDTSIWDLMFFLMIFSFVATNLLIWLCLNLWWLYIYTNLSWLLIIKEWCLSFWDTFRYQSIYCILYEWIIRYIIII